MSNKYKDYFEVDEDYFPQINDSSIAAAKSDFWKRTYPHETFVKMLIDMERVLSRKEKRSLWIEGAYGTGKSQCAYALKKILEVSEHDLRDYWGTYDNLKQKSDLLERFLGHKDKGIITVHRYASGGINSPQSLFLAIQDSILKVLKENSLYTGEKTLKDSAIAWLEKPAQKAFLNKCLEYPEWASLFSQSSAEEVLDSLQKGKEIKILMDNLFKLADKEGITALSIDANRLIEWIKDVIDKNDIRIVFIWDEFSDYFKNNKGTLSDFQKLVELVSLKPFYFIIVTHESGHLISGQDNTWKKVRDRFISVQISLPDNIAFNLIGHAFTPKNAALEEWKKYILELNSRIYDSSREVMKVAKIENQHVLNNILPIHPMAALLLKNIASAFKSNQRSMFDFIKSSETADVKAFQWFIENTGPLDENPFLTVDMLWDFFYVKGKSNLASDIRMILDTFPQQKDLREEEKIVLKSILIMQAISQRLAGAIELFKVTEKNLKYIFEGCFSTGLDMACVSIARELVRKGILVSNPIEHGHHVFTAAVLAGDQTKIENYKKEIATKSTTSKLITEGNLADLLQLPPALRLRFESESNTGKLTSVSNIDIKRTINGLSEFKSNWKIPVVLVFAKDEVEASSLRINLSSYIKQERYEDIIFIDTLSSPLGEESLEQYVELSAMARYYHGNNNQTSKDNDLKAKRVLEKDWKNRIYNGQFVVYTTSNPNGEVLNGRDQVISYLQSIVKQRYPFIYDFNEGLTENQLKLTNTKASAKGGITQVTSGVTKGIEKSTIYQVWNVDEYWEDESKSELHISKIKNELEVLVRRKFEDDGRISIGDVYSFLEEKYGFAPSNLTAFFIGFLLKEYSTDPYRYGDSSNRHETMTSDKLAEMIGNYIGKKSKPTFIVKMTPEERLFYEQTEKIWHLESNSCSTVDQAARLIQEKMNKLGLPVWCLSEVDTNSVYFVLEKYIELVRTEGDGAQKKAMEIGTIYTRDKAIAKNLELLLSIEKCQNGMRKFLGKFENGMVLELATDIGVNDKILEDVSTIFEVKHSCLWDKKTGEDEIRKLLVYYNIVKISNNVLGTSSQSYEESFEKWRDRFKFFKVSNETIRIQYPSLRILIKLFLKVYDHDKLLFEELKTLCNELQKNEELIQDLLSSEKKIFVKTYEPYSRNLTEEDIGDIKVKLPSDMFKQQDTKCNAVFKQAAEEYRGGLLRTKMFKIWKEKTKTKNPRDWSSQYRTPILSCVPIERYADAKKAFDILNKQQPEEKEVEFVLDYVDHSNLFSVLSNESERNNFFRKSVLGEYACLLPDIEIVKDLLDELNIEHYEWHQNPHVKKRVEELAECEYKSGGSDKVITKIEEMENEQLKKYLKDLVKENIIVGIEIIKNERV